MSLIWQRGSIEERADMAATSTVIDKVEYAAIMEGWVKDYAEEERRGRVARMQPLKRDGLMKVAAWTASLAVSLAVWRVVYIHREGLLVIALGIGFVLPWAIAGGVWMVSAWRGEAGGN